jgi:hypothetical protein
MGGPPESALNNKLNASYRKISSYEMLSMALESNSFGTWLRTEARLGQLRKL